MKKTLEAILEVIQPNRSNLFSLLLWYNPHAMCGAYGFSVKDEREVYNRFGVINKLRIFTSDGLNAYFSALTAHFGYWLKEAGSKRKQWQVATGLLYGQVKKRYQLRKLVRVRQVIRLGTAPAFTESLAQAREGVDRQVRPRYRQRTEALAAGRTSRRWTAREVLCYPLPPIPA
jgi:hypothetical protein